MNRSRILAPKQLMTDILLGTFHSLLSIIGIYKTKTFQIVHRPYSIRI